MSLFTRGMAIALLSLGLIGVSGCAEDNETEAQKLAKTAGDPGAPAPAKVKTEGGDLPPPTSSDDAFKRSSAAGANVPSDYPHANKKPSTAGKKE